MVTRPAPPSPSAAATAATPLTDAHARVLGRQLLVYTPDGPVGGTFTCTQCQAQGWQPDLLDHAAGCPYRASGLAGFGPVPGTGPAPR